MAAPEIGSRGNALTLVDARGITDLQGEGMLNLRAVAQRVATTADRPHGFGVVAGRSEQGENGIGEHFSCPGVSFSEAVDAALLPGRAGLRNSAVRAGGQDGWHG